MFGFLLEMDDRLSAGYQSCWDWGQLNVRMFLNEPSMRMRNTETNLPSVSTISSAGFNSNSQQWWKLGTDYGDSMEAKHIHAYMNNCASRVIINCIVATKISPDVWQWSIHLKIVKYVKLSVLGETLQGLNEERGEKIKIVGRSIEPGVRESESKSCR